MSNFENNTVIVMKNKNIKKITDSILKELRSDPVKEEQYIFENVNKDKEASRTISDMIEMLIKHSQNLDIQFDHLRNRITVASNIERKNNSKSITQSPYLVKGEDVTPVTISLYKNLGFTISINYKITVYKDKKIYSKFEKKLLAINKTIIRNELNETIKTLIDNSVLKRGTNIDELVGDEKSN